MSDQVRQVKDRLNIVDVVGQYVQLTKAGKSYKGLSPFNKEKSPSFFVDPDKGMYYDFSSGQGGDIFSFVEKMEGVDFKGALHILAEKAGVELVKESPQTRGLRDALYAIHEETTRFFETKLFENNDAIEYLKKRGVEESTMRSFRLGFAPLGWEELHDHLTKKGFKILDIEKAGVIKKSEKGTYYDRFRSRIIFPLMDSTGKVIAFSGRIFGEPAKDDKNAKYLNSPETLLFDKSRVLYGFHKAKHYIRKYNFTILVEGQMDLVLSHQVGYGNTVAVSGTGLTPDHISLIEKLSKRLVMAFDADRAGITSAGKGATLALKHNMDVKIAHVPEGKDPADCISESPAKWKAIIRDSTHVVDFFMQRLLSQAQEEEWGTRKKITEVRNSVLPFIACIQSSIERAHFEDMVGTSLGITPEAIRDDVLALMHETKHGAPIPTKQTSAQTAEEYTPSFSRKEDLEKTLAGFLFMQDSLQNDLFNTSSVREKSKEFGINLEELQERYIVQKETLVKESNEKYPASEDPTEIAQSLMKDLGKIYVNNALTFIRIMQIDAEREKDIEKVDALEKKVSELSKLKEALE